MFDEKNSLSFSCLGRENPPTPCPKGTSSALIRASNESTCQVRSNINFACLGEFFFQKVCSSGTISLFEGAVTCSACPSGFACPNSTSTIRCQQGTYSLNGSSVCEDCPLGFVCPDVASQPEVREKLKLKFAKFIYIYNIYIHTCIPYWHCYAVSKAWSIYVLILIFSFLRRGVVLISYSNIFFSFRDAFLVTILVWNRSHVFHVHLVTSVTIQPSRRLLASTATIVQER